MRRVRGLLGGLLEAAALAAAALLVALLALPPLALALRVSPGALLARLVAPDVIQALRLTLMTTALSTLLTLLLGIPLAYVLVTRRFRGSRLIEALVDLPMVLPPTVAGAGLLFACGRAGWLGAALKVFGVTLPFTTAAVVMAQTFVAAPFFVSTFVAGLRAVEPRYVEVATTLRAAPGFVFLRVMLPLAAPSLLAGAGMCWARALGEFGATITFAGNLPGVTRTLPLAVYTALQSDLDAAVALAVLLLVVSLVVLLLLRLFPAGLLSGRSRAPRGAG
jgi:molybdate transport system permease protein